MSSKEPIFIISYGFHVQNLSDKWKDDYLYNLNQKYFDKLKPHDLKLGYCGFEGAVNLVGITVLNSSGAEIGTINMGKLQVKVYEAEQFFFEFPEVEKELKELCGSTEKNPRFMQFKDCV
jgi:hypothetical protein